MSFPLRGFVVTWSVALGLGAALGLPAGLVVGQVSAGYPGGDRALTDGGMLLGLEAARHLGRVVAALPQLGLDYLLLAGLVMLVPTGITALDAGAAPRSLGAATGRVVSRLPGLLGVALLAGVARLFAALVAWALAESFRRLGSTDRSATVLAALGALAGGVTFGAVRLFQETSTAAHLLGDEGYLAALGRGLRAGTRVWARGALFAYALTLATLGVVLGAALVPTSSLLASATIHVAATGLIAASRTWLVAWCAVVVARSK